MYLIDTSVLIDFLKERETVAVKYFINILEQNLPFGITSVIYQEILQGASTTQDTKYLVNYLGSQRFYFPQDPIDSYAAAANLYRLCRNKGITIRSSIDCLIAQIAIEYELLLLHNDIDYVRIQKAVPKLKLVELGRTPH
jgi:hypothetical protein